MIHEPKHATCIPDTAPPFVLLQQRREAMQHRVTTLLHHRAFHDPPQRDALKGLADELVALQELEQELSRRHEELLETSHAIALERQCYHELVAHSRDGYLVTDGRGTIREANQAAATLLCTPPNRLVGMRLSSFTAEHACEVVQALLHQAQKDETIRTQKVEFCPAGGAPFIGTLTAATVRAPDGTLRGIHWLLRESGQRQQGTVRLLSAVRAAPRGTPLRVLGEGPSARTVLSLDDLARHSPRMRAVLDTVVRVAPSDANVLLTGESGVGKEVVAQTVHHLSPRARHEFVAVNCATLSAETLENELFGHERGAFTSAEERKAGMFEVAHGGTLFLDEVSEMAPSCQAKVLRALEQREFRRLGGTRTITVDVRLIAASNVDLEEAVKAGQFRRDLFYRLKVVHIPIPPLRERRESILPLVQHFLHEFSAKYGKDPCVLTREALARLTDYPWPGNVRELRNVIESVVLLSATKQIGLADLPAEINATPHRRDICLPFGIALREAEKEIVRRHLEALPTKTEVARVLQISLRTLYSKIKAYGLLTAHRRG